MHPFDLEPFVTDTGITTDADSRVAAETSLYFDLFWHSPEALLVAKPDGVTLDIVNPAYARMHGYAPGELDGQAIACLYPPDCHDSLRIHAQQTGKTGEHEWETLHIRKDGSIFPVWMKVRVLRDAQGDVRLRIASAQDISHLHRLEEQATETMNLLKAIADNSTAGISVKDHEGRYLLSNPHSDSALGVATGGALGKTDHDFFPVAYADIFRANDLMVLRSGKALETEETVPAAEGDRTFLCLKFPLFGSDDIPYATGLIGTEITERKRLEAELLNNRQQLEDLALHLRRAMQETHHRVKNNLQVIASLAEMQIDPSVEVLPLGAMRRVIHHIHTLAGLHDLLTHHAKLDEHAGVVSAQELFKKLLPLLQASLDGRQLHARMADVPLSSRMAAAFALLSNELVSNAIKHGKGDISLTMTQEAEMVCFTVTDDGPGFPLDFDPQQSASTGLELIDSIVRYDLHGSITYTNRPSGGACIEVMFPLIAFPLEG